VVFAYPMQMCPGSSTWGWGLLKVEEKRNISRVGVAGVAGTKRGWGGMEKQGELALRKTGMPCGSDTRGESLLWLLFGGWLVNFLIMFVGDCTDSVCTCIVGPVGLGTP